MCLPGADSAFCASATSVTLLVLQNSAPNRANGAIYLWADATLAIAQEGLLLRTGTVPTAKTGKGGGSGGDAADRPDADANANAQWVDKVSSGVRLLPHARERIAVIAIA